MSFFAPLQVTDIQKTLESRKALSQKSRTMLRNTLVHNTVTMAQNAATQQGRARERESLGMRERGMNAVVSSDLKANPPWC